MSQEIYTIFDVLLELPIWSKNSSQGLIFYLSFLAAQNMKNKNNIDKH